MLPFLQASICDWSCDSATEQLEGKLQLNYVTMLKWSNLHPCQALTSGWFLSSPNTAQYSDTKHLKTKTAELNCHEQQHTWEKKYHRCKQALPTLAWRKHTSHIQTSPLVKNKKEKHFPSEHSHESCHEFCGMEGNGFCKSRQETSYTKPVPHAGIKSPAFTRTGRD